MGGGGAMRAAAKVAGIGVVNGGLRGAPAVSPVGHPVTAAAGKATHPVSAILSSSDGGKSNVLTASVQRPCWDDWEFAGGEDELIIESGEPMPRLVFGGIPTLQEAKQTTSELSDAVDKIYLSKSVGEDSLRTGQSPSLSLLSNSEYLETKACVTSETTIPPTVPKSALQAFRLLNESPRAQSVVASIVCDPNVWDAVMQNEELVGFLHSQKTDFDSIVNKSMAEAEIQYQHYPERFDGSSKSEHPGESGNGFLDMLHDIKRTVVEMMSSLSDYFQSFFGGSSAEKVSATADGSAPSTFVDKALASSFIGLAVMVIMLVVLKRA